MRARLLILFALLLPAGARAATAISADGVAIHYTVLGDRGPFVVLLSGGPGEAVESMQGPADHLRHNFRCVMLEQRGTGHSHVTKYDPSTINLKAYIDDIEAVRKDLGSPTIILLGNSWGMMLALAYGGAHPDSVAAIVTLGSGPITREYLRVFAANQISRLGPSDREVIELWSSAAQTSRDPDRAAFERTRATAPAYFFDRKIALRYAAELEQSDFNRRIIPPFLEAEGEFDFRPLLQRITAPVLLVQGRQDLAGEANIDEAHALIKSSTLRFINECGHIPWLEKPDETWKITDDFLAPFASDRK